MPLLELQGVSKHFGGLQVVSDLSLGVGKGEILSLIGPNGAGKTTVLNLITGLYAPSKGDIRFDGNSIAGMPMHQITCSQIMGGSFVVQSGVMIATSTNSRKRPRLTRNAAVSLRLWLVP